VFWSLQRHVVVATASCCGCYGVWHFGVVVVQQMRAAAAAADDDDDLASGARA
jgi:hypothetical protein